MTIKTRIKGDLSTDDITMLNDINARHLSQMFEEKVPSICDTPLVDGSYRCFRPAYSDYITLTPKEFTNAIRCVAFSTLNLYAHQHRMSAYSLGFSDEQIDNSADNYGREKRNASTNVYRLLD